MDKIKRRGASSRSIQPGTVVEPQPGLSVPICATIDPVTRLEGHMKVQVKIDVVDGVQQVVEAWCSGMLFRGFEIILVNRDPRDAPQITERICGVCPVAHAHTSVLALDKAFDVRPPANGRILRNLVNGANFIDSHILHFYHLSLLDFVDGPKGKPWDTTWNLDRRLDATAQEALVANYVRALEMRRKAAEMGAIFGGKLPHPPAFVPGGFTTVPRNSDVSTFSSYLDELIHFIQDVYVPDVEKLAEAYPDYSALGKGPGNLLAFGAFPVDDVAAHRLFPAGFVADGGTNVDELSPDWITEQVTHSWYADHTNNLNPAEGRTETAHPKDGAYSWVKAPRYNDLVCEVGPLARMWIKGEYRRGISVMDRHRARAAEALLLARMLKHWIRDLRLDAPSYHSAQVPQEARAVGLSEAPRGALGHWVKISSSKIAHYQVLTPTCWNCSPRDQRDRPGPLEQALVGTPVKDGSRPVEVLRVIHSFDPCLDCAVHVSRPDPGARVFCLSGRAALV